MPEEPLVADGRVAFNAAVASCPDDRRFCTEWLPAKTGSTRPQFSEGRVYAGFQETLFRVLAWYKPHKIGTFKPLGWTLDSHVLSRVDLALKSIIGRAIAEAPLHDRALWLKAFDSSLLARYTAIDHRFQTVTGHQIQRVLDFGSGIGRTVYLWAEQAQVISVDAIESLYLLQRECFHGLYGRESNDWIDTGGLAEVRVNHLPTWEMDAIAAQSCDLIVAVQILQELNEPTLRYVLAQFARVIRPGSLLYIRDSEFWTPMHRVRVGRVLLQSGWRLTFRHQADDRSEIEGLPRLWVYTGEDNQRFFRWSSRLRRAILPSYRDSYGAWKDLGLPI